MRNLLFSNAETKAQIGCAVTAQLTSAFGFGHMFSAISQKP